MKEIDREKIRHLEDIGQHLMLDSTEQLLCGKQLEQERWQGMVGVYTEIVALGRQESDESIPPLAHAIGQLALLITSSMLDVTFHPQDTSGPELDFPRALADVIVAKRRSELDQEQPVYSLELAKELLNLLEFAKKLFEFLPEEALRERISKWCQVIAEVFEHALELFSQQHNLVDAAEATSLFVGLANSFANRAQIYTYMQKALDWGEQVLAANTPFALERLHSLILAANLVPTLNWFAGMYPSESQRYFERGVIVAEYWRNAVQIAVDTLQHEYYLMMLKNSSHALLLFHIWLATRGPDRFYIYAYKLWKILREYLDLAEQQNDPDVESESFALRGAYSVKLKELDSDWVSPVVRFRQEDIVFPESFTPMHFGMYPVLRKKQAAKLAQHIVQYSTISQQEKILEEMLDVWYSELTYLLRKIISEVGLNFSVCRFILVLGLVASGRVDPLGSLLSEEFFTKQSSSAQNDSLLHYEEEFPQDQQSLPEKYDVEAKNSIGTIVGLVVFAETLRRTSELRENLGMALRERNAILLRDILSSNNTIQRLSNKMMTSLEDLDALGNFFPEHARSSMVNSYDKTSLLAEGEELMPAPLSVEKLAVLRTLTGHASSTLSVVISPDGQTLVSGGGDRRIKVWDLSTGEQTRTLIGHRHVVWCVAISPDGQTLVSGSWDYTIKVWDLSTGKEWCPPPGYTGPVMSVAITRDGQTLTGHTDAVWCVAISPDGQTLVSGSLDNTIKVWDLSTGKEVRTLTGHTDAVVSVAISPDGQTLVSGSWDGTIKVWDLSTGKEVRTLTGHTDAVWCVAINPDGQTLVSGSRDYTIKVWDLSTGKEVRTLTGHTNIVLSVAISPDGQTLVSGCIDSTIKVWELSTGKEVRTLTGHTKDVTSVAISPDGQTLVSGSSDRRIKVWGA